MSERGFEKQYEQMLDQYREILINVRADMSRAKAERGVAEREAARREWWSVYTDRQLAQMWDIAVGREGYDWFHDYAAMLVGMYGVGANRIPSVNCLHDLTVEMARRREEAAK